MRRSAVDNTDFGMARTREAKMNPAKTTWFYGEERFAEILSFVADARSRGERRNVAHERYICFILGTARLASAAERASNRVSTCTWMHQV